MITTYTQPQNIETSEIDWWFLYDSENVILISPDQCTGITSSPHTMVVADTFEECAQYITDHELISQDNDL